jgi:hypothetical protein
VHCRVKLVLRNGARRLGASRRQVPRIVSAYAQGYTIDHDALFAAAVEATLADRCGFPSFYREGLCQCLCRCVGGVEDKL